MKYRLVFTDLRSNNSIISAVYETDGSKEDMRDYYMDLLERGAIVLSLQRKTGSEVVIGSESVSNGMIEIKEVDK